MKEKIINWLFDNYPLILILIVTLALFYTNYLSTTYLTGWDNLHPEFNFQLNIRQSIFGVWQEHQGLGVLAGMQEGAAIIYKLVLYALSFFVKENLLRYIFVFSMLFIGSSGAYYLIKNFISKLTNNEKATAFSFVGALFYLINISTIQTFYAPFEAFVAHYAFIPWIILSSVKFLNLPNKKNTLLLAIVILLASIQAYLPTLFVVTLMVISIYCLVFFLTNRSKKTLKKISILFGLIFLINSFWLQPFLFSTFDVASVNINSKINQMVTQTIFLRNKEFGDILNVALLKGFWFHNVDYNLAGIPSIMFSPWNVFFDNPLIKIIGYFLFSIIVIGVVSSAKKYSPQLLPVIVLFVFGFTMLATNTFPLSVFNAIFREISIFNQIFRFPFTKFSNVASLFFSFFLSFGILEVSIFLQKRKRNLELAFFGLIIVFILILSSPAFFGNFFYQKERLVIPKEYTQLFDYFKQQDPNTRIANFPQHTFWGWNFYKWGYSGSGFLWHGIRQPILDRAFDVWSVQNENYYWEISNALYSKNPKLVEEVLNKYQVTWLILDGNIINPPSPKTIFEDEFKETVSKIPSIKKVKQFENIEVYKVNLQDKPKDYIVIKKELQSVNSYNWSNFDQAFSDYSSYISEENGFNIFYPFRSLLTEKEKLNIKEESNFIEVKQIISENTINSKLVIPSPISGERIIPIKITATDDGKNIDLKYILWTPEVFIKEENKLKKIWNEDIEQELLTIPSNNNYPISIDINGSNFTLEKKQLQTNTLIGSSSLSISENNRIVITDSKNRTLFNISISASDLSNKFLQTSNTFKINTHKGDELIVRLPKITDNKQSINFSPNTTSPGIYSNTTECNPFRSGKTNNKVEKNIFLMDAVNTKSCFSIYSLSLNHEEGYIIFIDSQNKKGLPLNFWVLNEDEGYAPINTYLPKNKNSVTTTYILPPQEQFGQAYSLHFDNESIGSDESTNAISKVQMYPFAYSFMSGIKIEKDKTVNNESEMNFDSSHPNESLYILNKQPINSIVILSQSYSSGWRMYEFDKAPSKIDIFLPFLKGKENKTHLMINNWENGWKTTKQSAVVIYLPQYLQYLGWATLLFTFIGIVLYETKHNKNS